MSVTKTANIQQDRSQEAKIHYEITLANSNQKLIIDYNSANPGTATDIQLELVERRTDPKTYKFEETKYEALRFNGNNVIVDDLVNGKQKYLSYASNSPTLKASLQKMLSTVTKNDDISAVEAGQLNVFRAAVDKALTHAAQKNIGQSEIDTSPEDTKEVNDAVNAVLFPKRAVAKPSKGRQ